MIIINMKSFLKLFGQLLRFIAVYVRAKNVFHLCTKTCQRNEIETKIFPEKGRQSSHREAGN